jgi:hypothetical protein
MKIEFKTSGAAFKDVDGEENIYYKTAEVIRILNRVINRIEDGRTDGAIMDVNGNKIGEWSL